MSPSCDIEDRRRAKHAVVPVGAHERNDSATLIDRRDGRDRSVIARIFPDERSEAAGRPHGPIVPRQRQSTVCRTVRCPRLLVPRTTVDVAPTRTADAVGLLSVYSRCPQRG